jgi:uncharacterized membrane protein YbhN (UPF0104 family)
LTGVPTPEEQAPEPGRFGWRLALRAALSVGLAGALLGYVLPTVTGTRWSEIADVITRLSAADVALLAAVWAIALWCYGFVITATVPGMRHAQAITVNVTSSAVSNLMPFGGALGVATTFTMARGRGFAPSTMALSTLVTGIWNILAKLALPMLGLLALIWAPGVSASWLIRPAAAGAAVLALALAVLIGALWSEKVTLIVGRIVAAVGQAGLRLVGSPRQLAWDQTLPRWRHQVIGLVRAGWVKLTFGLAGFLGAEALLLYLILTQLGSTLGPAQVFAGFAFGRLISIIVVTPAGTGFTETGTAGLLVALGGNPAVCTSAVLLSAGLCVPGDPGRRHRLPGVASASFLASLSLTTFS